MGPDSEEENSADESEVVAEEAVSEEPESEDSQAAESGGQDFENMTVAELKELLKAAGKPVSGKKADLIARLQE